MGRSFFTRAKRSTGTFLKKNKLAQNLYDRAMEKMSGSGMYTGRGVYSGARSGRRGPSARAYGRVGRGVAMKRRRSVGGTQTNVNSLIAAGSGSGAIPVFGSKNDETGSLTVTHREYIRDIYGNDVVGGIPNAFEHQSIALNPGMEASFPWLSQVAQNFEEYEFKQLIFTYRSTIADVSSANGQVGTLIMTTNYNASEPAFTNKSSMMGYAHSASQKTTENMLHGVECDPKKLSGARGKYVRAQGLDSDQDIKTYDHGTFQLAIANTPAALANGTIGELWVSYSVSLRKPKYFTKEGFGISRDIFRSNRDLNGGGSNYSCAVLGMFGGSLAKGVHNSIGCSIRQIKPASVPFSDDLLGIEITFPGSYAGNVEVELRLFSAGGGGLLVPAFPDIDPPFFWSGFGNVRGIQDIVGSGHPTGNGGGVGLIPNVSDNVGATDADVWITTIHCRVDIASNGTDNTIQIFINPANMTDEASWPWQDVLSNCVLDIAEYNATFGSLSSVAPQYVDSAGVPVAY